MQTGFWNTDQSYYKCGPERTSSSIRVICLLCSFVICFVTCNVSYTPGRVSSVTPSKRCPELDPPGGVPLIVRRRVKTDLFVLLLTLCLTLKLLIVEFETVF